MASGGIGRFPGLVMLAPLLAASLAVAEASAQHIPIRDNSFLVEEAHNQEAGVVQHSLLLEAPEGGGGWELGFGQEWPLGGPTHQVSISVPWIRAGSQSGLGDIGLTYRHQLRGGGTSALALSPRFSLYLPTGDPDEGTGTGSVGLELALPASVELGGAVALHGNAAIGVTPSAHHPTRGTVTVVDAALGASVVWLTSSWANLLVEGVWTRTREAGGPGTTRSFVVPGVRFAWNLPGEVQVVPGIGYAIPVGSGAGRPGAMLAYLSLEHPFGRRLTPAERAGQLGVVPNSRVP